MGKIDNSRLTELCRELFFPFDSRFFRKDFCLGDNESEELKRIERLFILPKEPLINAQNTPPTLSSFNFLKFSRRYR